MARAESHVGAANSQAACTTRGPDRCIPGYAAVAASARRGSGLETRLGEVHSVRAAAMAAAAALKARGVQRQNDIKSAVERCGLHRPLRDRHPDEWRGNKPRADAVQVV